MFHAVSQPLRRQFAHDAAQIAHHVMKRRAQKKRRPHEGDVGPAMLSLGW